MARALQKDGWQVSNPKAIFYGNSGDLVYIDLEARYSPNGDFRHIYVEVKCFTNPINTHDLHAAIGQYIIYQSILVRQHDPRLLYLALPDDGYSDLNEVVRQILIEYQIKLIIVNLATERIIRWIE